MLANLVIIAALIVLMVVFTGLAISQFEKISHELRIKKLMLASVVVGLLTSLPEILVAITSSASGSPQISLGDLMGANIANLSWVVGGAAIVGRTIPVVGEYIREDLWVTMVLVLAPFILMADGDLSRFDGFVLLLGYLLYLADMIKKGRFDIKQSKMEGRLLHVKHKLKLKEKLTHIFGLCVALALVAVFSAELVRRAVAVSLTLGVSEFWVGLIVLAVGTTLPELVVSLEAAMNRKASLVLGNLFGSMVVNSTLIMALVAFIHPTKFEETAQKGLAGLFLVLILGLFWLFTATKKRLDRWEGVVLVGVYLMFLGLQFLVLR